MSLAILCGLLLFKKFVLIELPDHPIVVEHLKKISILLLFSVLRPDWPLLFHSMKSKQKSCQNEPSAGRFDGPRTRSDSGV